MKGMTNGVFGAEERKTAADVIREFADMIEKEADADVEITRSCDTRPEYGMDGLIKKRRMMGQALDVKLRWPEGKD